jgi:hypothetical protein
VGLSDFISMTDKNGWTALHGAASEGFVFCLRVGSILFRFARFNIRLNCARTHS